MTKSELLRFFERCPLVVSVQASEGSPVDDCQTLLRLAQASLMEGVLVLRLEGVENILAIHGTTMAPAIGLIKRRYADSDVYITPTLKEVQDLLATGCEIIAFDGTPRARPQGVQVGELVQAIHSGGRLAMADCDTAQTAEWAISQGADIISTTLSGYTEGSERVSGPDFELVRNAARAKEGALLIAEGRFSQSWEVRAALRAGADAVVVGGAINDPIKQTRSMLLGATLPNRSVGAIDIGGTWLRGGVVTADGRVLHSERIPVPRTRIERNAWINDFLQRHDLSEVGIGAGGTIDPQSGEVVFSKPIIPDHVGTNFQLEIQAERVFALNDGHATAWGHAMHPQFAGKRVATIALGTGVGFGIVDRGRILMGPRGEHPRLNDTPTRSGRIFDEMLGGAAVTASPQQQQIDDANEAAEEAVHLIRTLYYPDVIVMAGGVGFQPWLNRERLKSAGVGTSVTWSPYGQDAGLIGAGFLALLPTER